jgi:hypothetical protein
MYVYNAICILSLWPTVHLCYIISNNIYLENNQNIQYIKHSKYRQDSETSNYCFYLCYFAVHIKSLMIECITMNWDQCRDIKYDTLTQNSIQWKCEIIDHFRKLLWTFHPPFCYAYNIRTWLPTKKKKNKQNKHDIV